MGDRQQWQIVKKTLFFRLQMTYVSLPQRVFSQVAVDLLCSFNSSESLKVSSCKDLQ